MELINTKGKPPYIKINSRSKFTGVDYKYRNGDYPVHMAGAFTEGQLKVFVKEFQEVKTLRFINELAGENKFLYELKQLENLTLHFYGDVSAVVDFDKITPLKSLGINWFPKYLKNIDSQKNSLKHLSVSDYIAENFTPLRSLIHLESLRTIGGKLKSLEGIESFEALKNLEVSAHKGLTDISYIKELQHLRFVEFNTCWKLEDFSPLGSLKELEVLKIIDCKNLASIKFVEGMPKLRQLYTLGTTIINDYDTTPAQNIPVFFGSLASKKYNAQYPEKEIIEGQKTWSSYL